MVRTRFNSVASVENILSKWRPCFKSEAHTKAINWLMLWQLDTWETAMQRSWTESSEGALQEFLTPSSWDTEFVPLLYTDPLNSHRRKLGAKSCTRRFTNCLREKIPCRDGERNSMPGSGIFSREVKGNQINWTQNNMSWRKAEDFPWVFLYFI